MKKIIKILVLIICIFVITGCSNNDPIKITYISGRIEEKTEKELIEEITEDIDDFNSYAPTSKIEFTGIVKSIDTTNRAQLGNKYCKKEQMYMITFENDWILYINIGVDEFNIHGIPEGANVKVETNISQYKNSTLYLASYDGDGCWWGNTKTKVTKLD